MSLCLSRTLRSIDHHSILSQPLALHITHVSTFLTWNCSQQFHMKCVIFNLKIYKIISSILKLRDIFCALWSPLNLTSLCPIYLPTIQDSLLHITADVDVTQLHCLSYITFLFHNLIWRNEVLLQKSKDPPVANNFSVSYIPRSFTVVVTILRNLSIKLLSQMNPMYTFP